MNLRGLEAKIDMGEEEWKKKSGEIFNRGATGGEEIFGKTRWSLNSSHHACECSPELHPNCAARISWAGALHQKKKVDLCLPDRQTSDRRNIRCLCRPVTAADVCGCLVPFL